MTTFRRVVAPLAAMLTMAVTSPTAAAEKREGGPAQRGRGPTGSAGGAGRHAPPRKILRLEEMKVEGKIQKPQAMFLMPRANLNVGDLERADPLLPKIAEAIEREPF